jgi:hypothetical protein
MTAVESMSERAPAAVSEWADTFDAETVRLAYDEATKLPALFEDMAKSMDAKIITIFGVGAVVLGFAPVFREARPTGFALIPWAVAVTAFLFAGVLCHEAYSPRDMRVDPNPRRLAVSAWLDVSPERFRFYRLQDMGKTFDQNRDVLNDRAVALTCAMWCVTAEVVALAVALLTTV